MYCKFLFFILVSLEFIVCCFCPHLWKYELFLQEIEDHLQVIFMDGRREQIRKLLYVLGDQVFYLMKDAVLQSQPIKIERLFKILEMLSMRLKFTNDDLDKLEQLPCSDWYFVLKTNFWASQLTMEDKEKKKEAIYLLLEIENKKGTDFCKQLLENSRKLGEEAMVKSLHCQLYGDGQTEQVERSLSDIMLILEKEKDANSISHCIQILEEKTKVENPFVMPLEEAEEWIKNKTKLILPDEAEDFVSAYNAIVKSKMKFHLRAPQKVAILAMLTTQRELHNMLAQVSTGEGKSLIVAGIAIARAMSGMKVDVTTSSPLLAIRDSTWKISQGGLLEIFQAFKISVANNCVQEEEKRKQAYNAKIVYGELANFQRDFLLHTFYGKNVLGDRSFDCIVVDEVDCMLLDRGSNMLYLSHLIPGLESLESLFVNIWQKVNTPTLTIEDITSDTLYDIFGQLKREDLEAIHSSLKEDSVERDQLWAHLIQSKVIDAQGRLLLEKKITKERINYLRKPEINSKIIYFINNVIDRDRQIKIPKHLIPFVDLHLNSYISNAFQAVFLQPDIDYVVDFDRSRRSADLNPLVTIIDKDTGTDQTTSQWDGGLHQFLQL